MDTLSQPDASIGFSATLNLLNAQGSVRQQTHDGEPLTVRYIRASDTPSLLDFHDRSSEETLTRRFFINTKHMDRQHLSDEIRSLADLDPARKVALIALHHEDETERIVGVSRFAITAPAVAEFAVTIRDDFQRRGVGDLLFRLIVEVARAHGIVQLTALVQSDNIGMFRLIRGLGLPVTLERGYGETHVKIEVLP